MCDITKTFKATVKTVKTRQKSQGLKVEPDKSILHTKNRSEFSQQANNVVKSISTLKEFLLEHREEYINAKGHIGASSGKMSDFERDKIDSDAATLMQTCSEAIKTLKNDSLTNKVLQQVRDHRDSVFSLIEKYLKAICKVYSEQRAIRVKRVVDKKKISRLEKDKKGSSMNIGSIRLSKTQEGDKDADAPEASTSKTSLPAQEPPIVFVEDDDGLSPEELQMFEKENEQLYEEMNSVVDEVKNIESKVVEISRLQEIFTEKVLEQEKDIDRVADTVVGTTENIKEANEEIREAMKNNAGLRVWILFFLIVCSFSLLFLDWYNA